MLIPVNEPVLRFDYTGVNTFSVDWPFYGLGSIQVKATDKASVDPIVAQLVYGIDYSVSGVLASAQDSPQAYIRGSVTLLPPGTAKIPAVDPVIVIYRATDPEQQYQYAELDNFPALSHENALGQAIVLIQEILEELDRCIKAPLGANLTGDQYITELLEAIEQIADISGYLAEIQALAAQAAASASQAATYAGTATAAADTAVLSAATAATSATAAVNAASEAVAIVDEVKHMTAQATTLASTSPATATYSPVTGVLSLGIPKGDKGDTGNQGADGQRGPQGAGVEVEGHKNSAADLPATGSPGQAWLVGVAEPYDLYIWSADTSSWFNGGPLQGPPEATQAEVDGGTATGKYVSPKTLAGRGFRTAVEVDDAIDARGYQTAVEVDDAIDARGYQTAEEVGNIAGATLGAAKNQPGGVVGIEPNGDIDLTPLGASGKGRISCGPSVSASLYGGQYSAVFRTNKARGTKEAPEPPIAGDQAAAFIGYVYASTGWVQAIGILGYVTAANPSGVPLCSTRFYVGDGGGAALSLEVTPTVVEAGFDNKSSLGLGSRRWTTVYAATGAINTSDERIKSIVELPTKDYDALMASWGATVAPVLYKLNDSIEEKGFDRARTHMGFVAQRVAKAFSDAGLDAGGYGLWCHDRWDAQSEIKDKEDNITQAYRAAGDLYSLRYEECLVMEAAYQRWRADKIEDRLTVLETKMEVMANG